MVELGSRISAHSRQRRPQNDMQKWWSMNRVMLLRFECQMNLFTDFAFSPDRHI